VASSKREKELARQRAERQAARRAAAERKKKQRNAIIASVVAVLLVAGIGTAAALGLTGGDDEAPDVAAPAESATPSAVPTASPSGEVSDEPSAEPTAAEGPCTYSPSGEAARPVDLPPASGELAQQAGTALIETDRGNLSIDLLEAQAPCTVNSFASLAQQDYFADTPCHRLVTSGIFVLQCGDPTGTGTGGPGYAFDDENLEGATYPRGTVAMANAGPGTNGSQFFLVYQDSQLPPAYTPFGTITEGLDVLDTVAASGATPPGPNGNTAPNLPVQISNITVQPPA
jgi:peptidyl-prolyl cis-trans isomerase B (cyclophilin B)